ncbi:MAG: B12-binding domain-containing radical SAM protein [Nitrososphaerota archaeon]|nr:B12-binding domain-containing radical SAM protein [Nitrososphaerota archaeon]
MKSHVTFVNPPYPQGAHQHPPFIPLGIGYLAAVLERAGYQVDVIDCQAMKLTYDQFKEELAKRNPDVVGMSATTLIYKSGGECAKIAKEVNPKIVTLLGGSHVSFWDENALKEYPELDIVVRKEGEVTLLELMERIEAGKPYYDVVGTTCRNGDEIVKNPDRPYIQDLDSLPFPAHHLFPLDYLNKFGVVIFPVYTSRGCTFWCNFCSAVRMFGRGYRMRSPKNVVDELEHLVKDFGAQQFTFYDDAFSVDQNRVREICTLIQERGLKIKWDCETRVDMVDRELLQTMKDAGCIAVWFGVEAGSQMVIDAMGKGYKLETIKNSFKTAQDIGLMTVASVVLGFPEETPETLRETTKFIEELNPDDVGYYIATPYPGTPMYELVTQKGWLKIADFNRYDTATPIFETPYISSEQLKDMREKAFQSFYIRPSYIWKMWRKGGVYGKSATRTALAHLRRKIKSAF